MSVQWSLVLFTAIAGTGAWMFACTGIAELKGLGKKTAVPATIVALILAIAGGFASLSHLSHPERVFGALGHPTSGIFMEAVLLGLIVLCAIIYLILVKRDAAKSARKLFGVLGIILAVVFTFACGMSYEMSSRAVWNTFTLPFAYLGTAMVSGCAGYLLMTGICKDDIASIETAGNETLLGGIASVLTAFIYGCVSGAAGGSVAALFWIVVIGCGGIAPIVFGKIAGNNTAKATAYGVIALAGALVGAIAFRAIMWMIGTTVINVFGTVL